MMLIRSSSEKAEVGTERLSYRHTTGKTRVEKHVYFCKILQQWTNGQQTASRTTNADEVTSKVDRTSFHTYSKNRLSRKNEGRKTSAGHLVESLSSLRSRYYDGGRFCMKRFPNNFINFFDISKWNLYRQGLQTTGSISTLNTGYFQLIVLPSTSITSKIGEGLLFKKEYGIIPRFLECDWTKRVQINKSRCRKGRYRLLSYKS